MSNKWITKKQVEIYMNARKEGYTQEVCAAKSGVSVRSGRLIESNQRQDPTQRERYWRTRKDPLSQAWDDVLVPMLEQSPKLQAITLLEYLQTEHPGQYNDSLLRTLQRRVKQWKAIYGPEREVMFRQQQSPGILGLSDFTQLKRVTVTIGGQRFDHLLYHFRLIYSKWSYLKVIVGGESYTALAEGLQNALTCLGGAPLEHRTDSLSAAYKNLNQSDQLDITSSYNALCQHYHMVGTRNNRGQSHENGGIESPHGHLKRRIEQALILRNSDDFESVDAYQIFIHEVVHQHNCRNAKAIGLERQSLQPLPQASAMDYTLVQSVVTSSSTIDVRRVTYTVPSRLQAQTLQVRLYDDRLACYLGRDHVITLRRIYPIGKGTRARQVDYRHVIHSLIKKPQAFLHSQIRDDLLPSVSYQKIWKNLRLSRESRIACKLMVGLLYLAATKNCERELAQVVLKLIDNKQSLSLTDLQKQFGQVATLSPPPVQITQHTLACYNQLIPHHEEACHV